MTITAGVPPLDLTLLPVLTEASQHLVRLVDEIPDPAYAGASTLPGWTRAHVVAHLALNAESLEGVLREAAQGRTGAMYPGAARRDADIAELAAAEPAEVRERLLASVRRFADALSLMPASAGGAWDGSFRRVTEGEQLLPVTTVLDMRHREVEFHQADLDVGYGPGDWPAQFAVRAVGALHDRAPGVTLLATDLGRTWHADPGRTTVSGAASAIAWWLGGRGAGEGLETNGGELPQIQEW